MAVALAVALPLGVGALSAHERAGATRTRLTRRLAEVESRLTMARAAAARAHQLEIELAGLEADIARLRAILPAELDPASVVADLSRRAALAGVEVEECETREYPLESPARAEIRLVVFGREADARAFLAGLPRQARLSRFREEETTDSGIEGILEVFALAEPAGGGAPPMDEATEEGPAWPYRAGLDRLRTATEAAERELTSLRSVDERVRRFERRRALLSGMVEVIARLRPGGT